MFLSKYGDYPKWDYPEDWERNKGAVEIIAEDQSGNTVAVEHTLIQPFKGEREDAQSFSQVLQPLDRDASLAVPGYLITISLPVGAIPKGVNWKEVGIRVKESFRKQKQLLPNGDSMLAVADLPFELTLSVQKLSMSNDYPGQILVGRTGMPDTLESVISKALSDKLPKLSAAQTSKRILLLEQNGVARGLQEFTKAIRSVHSQFPDLAIIDEVWLAHTPVWETEGMVWFFPVWPEFDLGKRFKAND